MEINWWQVIATVLSSGVISAFLTGLWFNERIEKVKIKLQRELYEYQTRYTLLHQQRAEAIQNIYAKISWIERTLLVIRANIIY